MACSSSDREQTDPVKQRVAAHWDRRAAHFDEDFGHSIRTAAERAAWDRILDSSLENRRQEEFNNRGAQVRRRVDRRAVGWLCRRGGRRLRVCWPAGAGGRDGGGSGYWRAGRTGVCGRTGRGARPERLWG